ncbi:MAG: hypothetical protein JRI59_09165, partial [Deltaproteobacteria bacterium]|nr:hypothetical protein [Deltaproteobacteria bacterium]
MKNDNANPHKIPVLFAATLSLLGALAILVVANTSRQQGTVESKASRAKRPEGVCPPFYLVDEEGNVIDPVNGLNPDKPYSPAKTCGKCHDYQKITQGYHFTQGKGETPTALQAARCLWVTTPGTYGGTWCSPAPLYRYLSPKNNQGPATMDMTSFSFITAGCGVCHPGGGSAEFDRAGRRYDRWMANPHSGLKPGAENHYDGDYYKARWSETGVLEADCLICHLPEYDMSIRQQQLKKLNFRWAATAGAGFGEVIGSIAQGQAPMVKYWKEKFNADGTISPHIVREPRNESCLACHEKPGWKKRGANFRARTDVHIRAGLKCVDCHPAGSFADDARISGKEEHQIGKGDDPGGHVRDDLDNTCRDCSSCHSTGQFGAPIAKHEWLPPLHLHEIACQTCHVPERAVKAAQVQASDVFNPGAKIPTKGKHLWTFYGPDMKYWNHYGELEMMGYDDKPTDPYPPVLVRYQGKIYPVNRVHSAWPAIMLEGKKGLMQPRMSDVYRMWTQHQKDPTKYPLLAKIVDDNGDNVPEINRAEEIDALIQSVAAMLQATGYPMEGKQVVWVMDDRVYTSGSNFRLVPKLTWEASPYANVHKYNHDIYPAKAALGVNGCVDCHNPASRVFFGRVVKYPFDEHAQPVTMAQYELIGLSGFWAKIGAWRETYIKPLVHGLLIALVCSFVVLAGAFAIARSEMETSKPMLRMLPWVIGFALATLAFIVTAQPELASYALPGRFWLDANHFLISLIILGTGA